MRLARWQVVAQLVEKHNWTRGAELGVFKGQTFFYLLDQFPRLAMVGVDRWQRTPGPVQDRETGFASYEKEPMEQHAMAVKSKAALYGKRARIFEMDTALAAALVKDMSLDFVFVDASHDTESVKKDISAWNMKLRPGGYFVGHDFNWPSVQRALKALEIVPTEHPANIWTYCP